MARHMFRFIRDLIPKPANRFKDSDPQRQACTVFQEA